MSWNYRIIESEGVFRICSVYYENDKPHSWCWDSYSASGDSFDEMAKDFSMQTQAYSKPVLHILEDEDTDERLVPWREDGIYTQSVEIEEIEPCKYASGGISWLGEERSWNDPLKERKTYPTDYPIYEEDYDLE